MIPELLLGVLSTLFSPVLLPAGSAMLEIEEADPEPVLA
jgi:hypothetical protein